MKYRSIELAVVSGPSSNLRTEGCFLRDAGDHLVSHQVVAGS